MDYNLLPLVRHAVEKPVWLDDGRFWYRDAETDGVTLQLVDPAHGTVRPAFDQVRLARALAAIAPAGTPIHADDLPIDQFTFSAGDAAVDLSGDVLRAHCDLGKQIRCTSLAGPVDAFRGHGPHAGMAISPDGKKIAYLRNWNLWVADVATGAETQLTTDGVKDFGYATDNAGWSRSSNPVLKWSPDSRKIATFQQDQRLDGEMYLVPVTNGHPALQAWKYPLVGDAHVTMIERVILDVDTRRIVRLKMPPDQHRSTLCDDLVCKSSWEDVQWSPDASHLAFASSSRDHKEVWLRVADASTGDVREVLHEATKTFFESGNGAVNWRYLPASNELLWFSERSGWGQLYLYDLTTGQLKRQITHGDGNVTQVLHVDPSTRTVQFLAVGRDPAVDPYFVSLYRVSMDGGESQQLTPGDATHDVKISPDGRAFIDIASTPTQPQTTVVRDAHGKLVMPVAKEDISHLEAIGWKPLTPITVKARDGRTDLFGFLFKPNTMEPGRRYPIVNYIYPGPQIGSCGSRDFSPAHRDLQSLAELGFVVVCIDGMGTPFRSKSFHEASYGDLADLTLPDQIAGMKQIAARYPFVDLDRAGIYGHSGGGNATAAAMFRDPDFFKVGIAESGNHDERDYEDDWAEKWAGLEVKKPDGSSNYDSQANQSLARNLKGHLLLAHGSMDENVPMNNTLLVVKALVAANRNFDMLILPNERHGYGASTQYMMRR